MKNDRFRAEDYSRAVMRTAVSQICLSAGLDGAKESALESLSDAALRYIGDLGRAATYYSGLSGRTELNLFDVVRGLEDIKAVGFTRGLNSSTCLAESSAAKQILRDADFEEESPFAQPIAKYPIPRVCKLIPSFEKLGETPPGKHIPSWLPAIPDPHTYMHTPVLRKKAADPRAEKIEQSRQRRKAERAFLNLQQKLIGVVSRSESTRESSLGENSIIPVGTDKIRVSVMEAFAPALESMKEEDNGDGDAERNLLPEKRPLINFRVKTGKKFAYESSDCSLKFAERRMNCVGRDFERDEKKRRAEFILKQSAENPQELTQL